MTTTTTSKIGWAFAVLVVILAPGAARAQNSSFAAAMRIPVDGTNQFWLDGVTTERWYEFMTHADRSYCVEVVPGECEQNRVDSVVELFASNGTTSLGVNDDGNIDPPLYRGSRICFFSAPGDFTTYFAKVFPNSALPGSRYFQIRIVETTLFSPYFQVATSAGYDAAPQIRNNTNAPVTVVLTAQNASGVPLTCSGSFVIPAEGMFTSGISGFCGVSSAFGSAQITHNGPPGAISANITTFSGVSGLSFDAAFGPRPKNTPPN